MNGEDWQSEQFRKDIKNKIDEAIKQTRNPVNKTADELEAHVFGKAHTKSDYLNYTIRLLQFLRDFVKNKPSTANSTSSSNANQSANSPASGSTQVLTLQPPASANAQKAQNVLTNNQTGSDSQTNQQAMNSSQNMDHNPLIINQVHMANPPQAMNQQQGQINQSLSQQPPNPMMQQQQMQPNQMMHQRVQMPQNRIMVNQMMMSNANQIPRPNQLMQQNSTIVHRLRQPNPNVAPSQVQQNSQVSNQSGPTSYQQGLTPQYAGPNQVMVGQTPQGSGIAQMHSQSSQQQTINANIQMAPSPGSYVASPSSMMASPMNMNMIGQRGPSSIQSVCSPNPTLNTPVMSAQASPQMRPQADEQAYKEKLRQLSKYIEPLRRMIAKIDACDGMGNDKKKESSKIKNLLEIISDSSRRCSIETLLKCEQVLEKMEFKFKVDISVSNNQQTHQIPYANVPLSKMANDYDICAPLVEAVKANMHRPYFNHTLQRTFGPAVAAMTNNLYELPQPDQFFGTNNCENFDWFAEEEEDELPHALQGELVKLDRKFRVELDSLQQKGSKTVQLICNLEDRSLPCVPPILLRIFANYPDAPPQCILDKSSYMCSNFLKEVYRLFGDSLSRLPDIHCISLILSRWEMAVRQAQEMCF